MNSGQLADPSTGDSRPRRADAERNRDGILDAAVRCLNEDPRAGMAAIAATAGIGRVTMYGHFSSRAELVETVFARTMQRAEAVLGDIDVDGEPFAAFERLVTASWRLLGTSRMILRAAEEELGRDRVRQLHADPLTRVQQLVERGRESGTFRADLPVGWLVTTFFTLLHSAADQVRSGNLREADAAGVVWATIASVFRGKVR